ncbi:MAG: hypothetical protein ACYTEK_12015 [Planctomycetota bacterium]
MPADLRRDDLFGVIGVSVLLIGTATGNAYAMLILSVATLVLMAVFGRKRLSPGVLLVALVAAFTAAVIAIVIQML